MASSAPKAFISYSHDSEAHNAWVLMLATRLMENGVDVTLDYWDVSPGSDLAGFMEQAVIGSDRVLIVCTPSYVAKANAGRGGVGYEKLIITGELVQKTDTTKFVPLMRSDAKSMPSCLGHRLYVDFTDDGLFEVKLKELLQDLHGVRPSKPPVGASPFSLALGTDAPPPVVSSTPALSSLRTLNEPWFEQKRAKATAGIAALKRPGYMEMRCLLQDSQISTDPRGLVTALRRASIKTFGWPIGLILDGNESYKPRPLPDGVEAEIAIAEGKAFSGAPSYDYWGARNNGDYYLLASLFEDERKANHIFFDTRIVRVAESLLFMADFYKKLGVADQHRVTLEHTHTGLSGRWLSAASQRHVTETRCNVESSSATTHSTVAGLVEHTAVHVEEILAPMFMLFDFAKFPSEIYREIVGEFKNGRIA